MSKKINGYITYDVNNVIWGRGITTDKSRKDAIKLLKLIGQKREPLTTVPCTWSLYEATPWLTGKEPWSIVGGVAGLDEDRKGDRVNKEVSDRREKFIHSTIHEKLDTLYDLMIELYSNK